MRPAEESVRPTRLYPTASYPFSASLRLSHTVLIGVDLLNRQSQDVKPKKSKLCVTLHNLAHEVPFGVGDSLKGLSGRKAGEHLVPVHSTLLSRREL